MKRTTGRTPKRAQKQAFTVPIYGGLIVACRSPAALAAACRPRGLDPPADLCDGLCLQADGQDGSVVYLLAVYNRSGATLVHEITHLVQFILIRAGIDPRDSNGETAAYLSGDLYAKLSIFFAAR